MRSTRTLTVAGMLCLLVAAASMAVGFRGPPWLIPVSAVLGLILLSAALIRARAEAPAAPTGDPARGQRLARVAILGLSGLGLVALLVALLVAEGEARGHAIAHLLTGLLCVGLFAALAFPWHPHAGSGAATLRGLVLTLLGLAAFGSFLESLGGAGYDAANGGRRIAALTTLHDVGLPFGVLLIGAVPLGAITGIAVFTAWAVRRGRTVRA
ncbi:MAG: hypothetical protein ABI635_08495 [Actinomycetota bacterium]